MKCFLIASSVLVLASSSDAFLTTLRDGSSMAATDRASFWRLEYRDHHPETVPILSNQLFAQTQSIAAPSLAYENPARGKNGTALCRRK
jgi:hypothetical protein